MRQKLLNIFFIFLCFTVLAANESPSYVVFLVDAPKLDYQSLSRFLKTAAKHPRDWSKNGDVGHAWIYLQGDDVLEGGHSGEFGEWQPRYMEGVMENIKLGAKNPVSYLWCSQCDGIFQSGSGGHRPTFAAKVPLSSDEYHQIRAYISSYPFSDYSITGYQCCSFIRGIAALIGLNIQDEVTIHIDQQMRIDGKMCRMWEDPRFSSISFSSPDRLEIALKRLVKEKKATCALQWYKNLSKKRI